MLHLRRLSTTCPLPPANLHPSSHTLVIHKLSHRLHQLPACQSQDYLWQHFKFPGQPSPLMRRPLAILSALHWIRTQETRLTQLHYHWIHYNPSKFTLTYQISHMCILGTSHSPNLPLYSPTICYPTICFPPICSFVQTGHCVLNSWNHILS